VVAAAVEFRKLSKAFGEVFASRELDLTVAEGTIHAIIGENGAGKSTAMKMLYGLLKPDSGQILVRGEPRRWRSPRDAIACGIGMVHQHFMLAGPLTVLENIVLGDAPAFRPIDWRGARRELDAIAGQGSGFLKVDWDARIENLSVGIQQRIEILKLLYRKASILILDEPTAVLTPLETDELFAYLKQLKARGSTILIITHKLREVLDLADEVTVFRAGQVVGHRRVAATDADELASLMVGRKVHLEIETPPPPVLGNPVLEVKDLTLASEKAHGKPVLSDVSFEIRGGEVVGIAGVEGNGQSQLLQLLSHPKDCYDSAHRLHGSLRCLGRDLLRLHARAIWEMGVIPEDQHLEGLLLDRPVTESYLLGLQKKFGRAGFLRDGQVARETARAIEEYDVRPRSLATEARRLSGGNQQKLIVAREFSRGVKFLIAAQPTRGVDVGAAELIHARIMRARAEGAGVLLVSSELDEVMKLSDRILVMYDGRIVAEFPRSEATQEKLGLCMGGGHL
jgi:general nucleoside transport system ATP-binding protein